MQVSAEDMGRILSQRTYSLREEEWFNSFAENLVKIRAGNNVFSLPRIKGPALVLGGGPSIQGKDLSLLKLFQGETLVCDKMLAPTLMQDMSPSIVASVDGSPQIKAFYDQPNVKPSKIIKACFATYVHPSVVQCCPYPIYWFNVIMGDDPVKDPVSITRAMYWMSGRKVMVNALGNVGAWLVTLAAELGASPIVLLGIDFSYGEENSPLNTPYWQGFLSIHGGNKQETLKKHYRYVESSGGKRVLTDIVMDSYRHSLQTALDKIGCEVWNCGEYSILRGGRVKALSLEEAVRKVTVR